MRDPDLAVATNERALHVAHSRGTTKVGVGRSRLLNDAVLLAESCANIICIACDASRRCYAALNAMLRFVNAIMKDLRTSYRIDRSRQNRVGDRRQQPIRNQAPKSRVTPSLRNSQTADHPLIRSGTRIRVAMLACALSSTNMTSRFRTTLPLSSGCSDSRQSHRRVCKARLERMLPLSLDHVFTYYSVAN